jgi:hypothetical protein
MSGMIAGAGRNDTIGGAPQLIRITQHMNTRALCVRWEGQDTLFGRPLFDYENIDYWIVDPYSCKFSRPRKFGNRLGDENERENTDPAMEQQVPEFDPGK